VIINNRLQPEFSVVEGSTLPVLGRSLSTLIKTHTRLTLIATQGFARTQNIGFNLTFIGDDFPKALKPTFETPYMRAVYQYGHEKALSANVWTNKVPFPGQTARQLILSRK
jgi:hypothetical protein